MFLKIYAKKICNSLFIIRLQYLRWLFVPQGVKKCLKILRIYIFFTLLHMPKVTQLLTMSRVLIISAHTADES